MLTQFLSNLSQNYIELLNDTEYYDVIIDVGEGPNPKPFYVHSSILLCRSLYLRNEFVSNRRDNIRITRLALPKIPPKIFEIILK